MTKNKTNSLFDCNDSKIECSHVVSIAFEAGVDSEFSYLVPDDVWPVTVGQRVEVPFGKSNKRVKGFCVETEVNNQKSLRKFKLKKVIRVIDKTPLLNDMLLSLARWISSYYICPLGQVLAAMVPAAVKKGIGIKKQKLVYLSEDYEKLTENLRSKKQKAIVAFLEEKSALNSKTAVKLRGVLEAVGCTNEPAKRLTEKLVIKITQREILESLPIIPKELTVKNEKVSLNQDQQNALSHIKEQIDSNEFAVTLLHGVTDSGKTEVYIKAIEKVLEKGKTAIVLLPEIALTAQTVQRFSSRFAKIAVMHSALTAVQRNVQWQKIKTGKANVVIGARSAVFAPLENLGLIVVDEEHEPSYKQDTQPRYHGRDVAIKRTQMAGAHCILGSATPSLESLYNCRCKEHFTLVSLPKRVMDLPFPEMKLIDLKKQCSLKTKHTLISPLLEEKLKIALNKKEQAILLLNRRGYSNFIFCPSCKHTIQCRNCDVTLTFHKSKTSADRMKTVTGEHVKLGFAICHYCGSKTLVSEKCPLCGKKMIMIGLGSQKLEEEIKEKFPKAMVSRIDSDSMQGKNYYKILKDFSEGKIDILAGTQMLAKGLHFPNVTVVGIISADTCLNLPDFRASERTFQLISQVAGRAGRSQKKGTVLVQTFLSNQPSVSYALRCDFNGFVNDELKHRKACNLPPFSRMAVVMMRDTKFDKLEIDSKIMRERIDRIIESYNLNVIVRGPLPAVISRVQRFHRMQIIVQAVDAADLQRLFAGLRVGGFLKSAVKTFVDIDPVTLL